MNTSLTWEIIVSQYHGFTCIQTNEPVPGLFFSQHFLGEHGLSLPLAYRHGALSRGELEPFVRLCLLDPSFPALVEEVEGELRRVLQD